MKIDLCPTVDANTTEEFNSQMERVTPFATRLHIDVADGSMTPQPLLALADIWWPGGVRADLHVMYRRPLEHLPALIALGPQLVILHAEAEGDFMEFAELLHRHGIEVGVALLPETDVTTIAPGLGVIDHVLLFSGKLGSFGGTADLSLLAKVHQLRAFKPQLEIGWDGGVNADNVATLVTGGVEVLNAGGFIQQAANPAAAYATLKNAIRPAPAAPRGRGGANYSIGASRKNVSHTHPDRSTAKP